MVLKVGPSGTSSIDSTQETDEKHPYSGPPSTAESGTLGGWGTPQSACEGALGGSIMHPLFGCLSSPSSRPVQGPGHPAVHSPALNPGPRSAQQRTHRPLNSRWFTLKWSRPHHTHPEEHASQTHQDVWVSHIPPLPALPLASFFLPGLISLLEWQEQRLEEEGLKRPFCAAPLFYTTGS